LRKAVQTTQGSKDGYTAAIGDDSPCFYDSDKTWSAAHGTARAVTLTVHQPCRKKPKGVEASASTAELQFDRGGICTKKYHVIDTD